MGPTQDAVKAVQEASLALTKAKDILRQKTAELEKLRQQQGSTGAGASGSGPPPNQKEIEKSEAKHRKAQEDYKVIQWCCVTELKVPSSGTSSNFDGTGTELVSFQKWWNLS